MNGHINGTYLNPKELSPFRLESSYARILTGLRAKVSVKIRPFDLNTFIIRLHILCCPAGLYRYHLLHN